MTKVSALPLMAALPMDVGSTNVSQSTLIRED